LEARLAAAEKERVRLERRCKDLAQEASTKGRQLQEAQDEMLALNVELNVAVGREKETRRDNEELLARWMELKGREAEEMNKASRWE
jgi:hypothetical protein